MRLVHNRISLICLYPVLLQTEADIPGHSTYEKTESYLNSEYGEQPSTDARFSTASDSALEMSCLFCS